MVSDETDQRVGYIRPIGAGWQQVVYSALNGVAVTQGDIVLGSVASMEALAAVLQAPELQSRHKVSSSGIATNFGKPFGAGIVSTDLLWPSRIVPYSVIDRSLDGVVASAIGEWNRRLASIKFHFEFRPKTSQDQEWIAIRLGPDNRSHVGRQRGGQDLSLADDATPIDAMHELGHALGLHHEVMRLDRDDFVRVYTENMYGHGAMQVHPYDTGKGRDLGQYDYGSIMHYGPSAFARAPGLTTIKQLRPGAAIGSARSPSDGDLASIRELYS